MKTLQYTTNQTPNGEFHIIFDDAGVARASGFGSIANLRNRLPEELRSVAVEPAPNHPYETAVAAYYAGSPSALDQIPRAQNGSEFQKTIWQVISGITYGQTLSYKALAEASGNPAAVRAAGTVCGLNRLILLVPCHRVLKTGGGIGSYLYGSAIKEFLLRHENALQS